MHRPYFHKLILSSTIREKRLRIPDDFAKKFGNELSTSVKLIVPGGHMSRVMVVKVDETFWFHHGWQLFVERYAVRAGYFLVFRYDGNAVFNVHIFNLPALEINYHSNALSGKRYLMFEELEENDPLEHQGSAHSQMMINKGYDSPPALQNLFSEPKFNNCLNWSAEDNMQLARAANISHMANLPGQNIAVEMGASEMKHSEDDIEFSTPEVEAPKPKKRGRKRLKVDPNEQLPGQNEDESDMRFRFYESASARKRTVTAEERERAMNAAKAFEPPENPYCRVVLRPSYLYRGCIMYLPSSFAEKNLNGISGFIKLQLPDGKQWPVRCLYKGGRAKFSQGWYEFTLENGLGEGDVCVFEMLKARDVVLKVTAFRVVDSAGGLMNQP